MFDVISRDARLAVRALLRTTGFTTAAVLTLGIGMGGTVLMLTAANAAFRRPLAFGNADRLVHVWQVSPRSNQIAVPLKVARDWEATAQSFDRAVTREAQSTLRVACGLPAALHYARLDLRSSLSGTSHAIAREPRGMRVLTAVEVAIACVLLVGAGLLLLGSLSNLEVVDPGFDADDVRVSTFTLGASPGSPSVEPERRAQFLGAVLERAHSVPGVERAGVTSSLPEGSRGTGPLRHQSP